MKVLIIGTGSIGQRHIHNIQMLATDIDFIFLRKNSRQDQLSERLGAKVIASVLEIEAADIDCAVVATPSALHTEIIVALVEMDIPMYVEKPVVTRQADIDAVEKALEINDYQQSSLTGCNLRFLPSLIKIKSMLEAKDIGNVVRATFQVGQWLPDWRPSQDYTQSYSAKPELGGGVIMDLIHELDAARWLLGEFDCIHAFSSDCPSLDIQSEAVASIIMKGKNTPLVSVNLDYVSRKPMRRYEFVGDKGTIVWDLVEKTMWLHDQEESMLIDCGIEGYNVAQTYETAMASFLGAIGKQRFLEQDIYEGLKSVKLALQVKEVVNR